MPINDCRIKTVGVLLLLVFISCSDPNPQEVLYPEEIEILTELLIIEGVLQDFSGEEKDTFATLYYNQLYDHFGMTEKDLVALRDRFSKDPTLWERAMDSVKTRLEGGRDNVTKLLEID